MSADAKRGRATKPPDDDKGASKDAALADRMFRARHYKEGQIGHKIVLREISAEVSAILKRDEDYDPSVVARWLKGEQEPKTRLQWAALARALSVDVGWLAFGEETKAPMARDETIGTGAPKLELRKPQRGMVPHARTRRGRSG